MYGLIRFGAGILPVAPVPQGVVAERIGVVSTAAFEGAALVILVALVSASTPDWRH